MTVNIALLKGINVGGRRRVTMADLRGLCAELDFNNVQSVLQSGNLVFRCDARSGSDLEMLLEREAGKRLDLTTDFIVRTATQWTEVVARNPFPSEAGSNPSRLIVMFLKSPPADGGPQSLKTAITGPEMVEVHGREAYLVYPKGVGNSRVTNSLVEKKLGSCCTGRNWNTVLKIAKLANA